LTVVVTGSIPGYKRDEAEAAVRNAGGKTASSVSKNTDLLIAGEKAGSKKTDAEKYGVKIIEVVEQVDFDSVVNPA
jgi:DNA ligase (NAD+)